MASDQQIVESLDSLLREVIPGTLTSLNDVVHLLQSRLGFDLSNKIDLIRARVTSFYSSQHRQVRHNQPAPPPPASAPAAVQQSPVFTTGAPSLQHSQYQLNYSQQGPVFHNATEISFSQPSHKPLAPNVTAPEAPATKEGSQSRPKRRGGAGGLNKLCGVSPELQTIVGQPALPRTEIVKQLWAYIRKNNLQDPRNKRKIICNDELRLVFETDATDMFQMNKLLAKHILPLDPSKDSAPQAKKAKVDEEPEVKKVESDPVVLSEALASFFDTSVKEMTQSEVLERIAEYIKAQGLEDPSNSTVTCDAKLQELLGCESLPAAGISDVLARNNLFQRS